jgi:ABC-type sugar transport system ATPase subunit
MMLATQIAVLEGGRLRQVGPPLELYHRPADRFVAGFIGSPAMNFVEGEITGQSFEAPGLRVPLAASLPPGKATLGVRPHDLVLSPTGVAGAATVVEPMGWEAFAHVTTAAGVLVIRLEGDAAARVRPGDRLSMGVPADKVHVFDATGKAVRHPAAQGEVVLRCG